MLQDDFVGFHHFIGIAGAESACSASRAKMQLLDGWCVGPSSPTPIESCVKMYIAGIPSTRRGAYSPHIVAEIKKNVALNARSFDSVMPFTIAPMACSRTPKWMLRPRYSFG